MTTSIAPLRKTSRSGKLYLRPKEILAKLEEITLLPRREIAVRCQILEPENPKYVPSECLVYLVREYRSQPMDECSEVLFKTLLERFEKGILKFGSELAATESLVESNIRDEAVSKFLVLLGQDRTVEYQTRLDFFEVRFNKCVAGIRYETKRKLYPEANRHRPMEFEEDGEPSVEFELAARGYTPFGPEELEDPDYGANLDQAIDELPPIQKTIVVMWRNGVKIESKEPDAVTISGTLKKTPKTIAKHRDLAFAKLKKTLKGETA
jgi:hypothetical protein